MTMNFIPKIVYGSGPTTITFVAPPSRDGDAGEYLVPTEKVTISISGVEQRSAQFLEGVRKFRFSLLTQSIVDSLKTFYINHGRLGKTFDFYEHATESSFVTYQLKKGSKFEPKRQVYKGGSGWLYELELEFRRVVA